VAALPVLVPPVLPLLPLLPTRRLLLPSSRCSTSSFASSIGSTPSRSWFAGHVRQLERSAVAMLSSGQSSQIPVVEYRAPVHIAHAMLSSVGCRPVGHPMQLPAHPLSTSHVAASELLASTRKPFGQRPHPDAPALENSPTGHASHTSTACGSARRPAEAPGGARDAQERVRR
jgi:hypothetical protein